MASERVPPPSTSSATPPMIALSNPGFCCCSRICSDRRMGRPASWRGEGRRGVVEGGELGGDGDELLARHAADRDRHLPPGPGALGRAALLLLHPLLGGLFADLGRVLSARADLGDRLLGGTGVDLVLDLLAGGVHRFVRIGGHRGTLVKLRARRLAREPRVSRYGANRPACGGRRGQAIPSIAERSCFRLAASNV